MEEQQQDVLKFLPKIFGRDIRKIVMNRSYRNTMEIAQYANRLTGVSDIELFDRHGDAVEEMQFKNLHTALDRVLEKWEQKREDYETEALVLLQKEKQSMRFFIWKKTQNT